MSAGDLVDGCPKFPVDLLYFNIRALSVSTAEVHTERLIILIVARIQFI